MVGQKKVALFIGIFLLFSIGFVSAEKMWNFNNHTVNISDDLYVGGKIFGDASGITGLNDAWNISGSNLFPKDLSYNVGIGTTSPTAKLNIQNGNVGTSSAYSDFVIEDVDAQMDLVSSSDGSWGSSLNLIEGNSSGNVNVWSIARGTSGAGNNLNFNFGNTNQHNNPTQVYFSSTGTVTASAFVGDGSGLTGIDAADVEDIWVNSSGDTMTGDLVLQNSDLSWNQAQFNFSAMPRTTISPMSMRLWDNYNVGGLTTYGTVLDIYGRSGHWQTNLYFGSDNSMYYRTSTWSGGTGENGVGEYNEWRKIWNDHNDGSGSGLDADTIDGLDSSSFALVSQAGRWNVSGNKLYPESLGYDVGIGTDNPESKLAVGNAEGGVFVDNYEIKLLNSGQRHWSIFNNQTSGKFIISDTSASSNMGSFGTERFSIDSSGNVGIGTTSPGAKLQVAGNAVISDKLILGSSASGEYINRAGSPYRIAFYTSGSEKMSLANNGNLGIGTSNPGAKLDVEGTAIANSLGVVGSGLHLTSPGGAQYSGSGSQNGAIKITLPTSWSNTMMRMTVKVYDYLDDNSFSIELGGYNYAGNNNWYSTFAQTIASESDRDYVVRFGHDGTNNAIWIGETTSSWQYLKVEVSEFYGSGVLSTWEDGWNIELDTDFTGDTITDTETNNFPYSDWNKIKNVPSGLQGGLSDVWVNESGDTMTGALAFTPTAPGAWVADTFSANTYKSYINFNSGSGSNDPGYIMHETSGTENNEGVLHIVPSDDNAYGDYVSIHGTNDPDMLKLHTSGDIEGVNTIGMSTSTERIDFDGANNQIEIMGGNVGIGTNNPSVELEVAGDISLGKDDANKLILYNNGASNSLQEFISGDSGNTGKMFFSSRQDFIFYLDSDSTSSATSFRILKDTTLGGAAGQELFRIQESGNVGIGETNPDSLLSVTSATDNVDIATFRFPSGSTGDNVELLFKGNDGTYNIDYASLEVGVESWSQDDGYIGFRTSDDNILSEKFRMTATGTLEVGYNYAGASSLDDSLVVEGDVGIGTLTPQNKLNVIGDINATGVIYGDGSGLTNLNLSDANLSGEYVPYSGAVQDVDLGAHDLRAGNIRQNASLSSVSIGPFATGVLSKTTALGSYAGYGNTQSRSTFVGSEAGRNNTGYMTTAIGEGAGYYNSGQYSSVLGLNAGRDNSGDTLSAVGSGAGLGNMGDNVVGIGGESAYFNYGDDSVFIGWQSGIEQEGNKSIAIGYQAGKYNLNNNVVAIGYQAGTTNSQDNKFIVQQKNVNTNPLIYGDFVTGQVNATDFCTTGGNCLSNAGGGGSSVWDLSGTTAYYNDGKVGIGTSNPDSLVGINYSGSSYPALRIIHEDQGGQAALSFIADPSVDTATGKIFSFKSSSDVWSRGMFYSDGKYGLGSGSAARDVFISRDSANTLKISSDGSTGSADLYVTGSAKIGSNLDIHGDIYDLDGSSLGFGDGDDDVSFNTDNLYIEALTGDVGIGLSTGIGGKLHVLGEGDDGVNNALVLDSISSDKEVTIAFHDAGNYKWFMGMEDDVDNSFSIFDWGNARVAFYIDGSSGSVGIGDSTISPGLKFDANGAVGATQYCDENGANCFSPSSVSGGSSYWNLTGSDLYVSDSNYDVGIGTSNPNARLTVNGDSGINLYHSNGQANHMYTNSDGQLVLGGQNIAGSGDYLWIDDDSGYVGIGTSSPGAKLDVSGAGVKLRVGPTYTTGGDRDFVDIISHGSDTRVKSVNERFHIENTGGSLVLQESSGNVGIGDASPAEKLEVNGNIGADALNARASQDLVINGTTGTGNVVIVIG